MTEKQDGAGHPSPRSEGRRGFFYTIAGGIIAALAGWISGGLPDETGDDAATPPPDDSRIAALEAEVARLAEQLANAGGSLGELEGEFGERVVFQKSELTVRNDEGVLLNLVAPSGPVGIRFYKDFDFGNEVHTNPWHMGYIEGNEGYQGLAILRDWSFTAALWDADGRLSLGRLDPHPPANPPAKARVYVRGTLDEVQTLIEASNDQTADVFQVTGRFKTNSLAVNGEGDVVAGSPEQPNAIILHDMRDGSAYSLSVVDGQLMLSGS